MASLIGSGDDGFSLLDEKGSSSDEYEDEEAGGGGGGGPSAAAAPKKPGFFSRLAAKASGVRATAKKEVAKPIGDFKRQVKMKALGDPKALRNEVSGDEDQLGLIATNAHQENLARGGDLGAAYGDIDTGVMASAAAAVTPTALSSAAANRRLGAVKARADAKGEFEPGSRDRDAFNQRKGDTITTGVRSVTTGAAKKLVSHGLTAGGAALAPFTGGASVAAASAASSGAGMGLDWVSDKVRDKKSAGHGVSEDDHIDMMVRNPGLADSMIAAQHGDQKTGNYHRDLAEVSPAAATGLSHAMATGRGGDAVKAHGKSSAYAAAHASPAPTPWVAFDD